MNFLSNEDIAIQAYKACFDQYGHHNTRDYNQAWSWLSEEQRRMWRDVARNVVNKLSDLAPPP